MSLISNFLEAAYCSGNHHRLAFHGLRHLQRSDREQWRQLFLSHHESFLKGSKDPDKVFKDFKNHVLHVQSGCWGGAPDLAREWYAKTVDELRAENWAGAAYAAGVLSHYVTDPVMPFHTAQSEAESNIHRAVEWSVNKSYLSLCEKIDAAAAAVQIESQKFGDWLEKLVTDGARYSNRDYQLLIDRYDFKNGAKNPPAGFDDVCRERVADCLGYAQVLFGRILDRAIEEAGVTPPKVNLTLDALVAALNIPIVWVTRKMADAAEQQIVKATWREFSKTGKVDKKLTEDVRVVRDLVRIRESKSDLASAPSIGPKTAARLEAIGLRSISDLITADAEKIAQKLNRRGMSADTVRDWQAQAKLAQAVPGLRGHDVQILVGGGIRDLASLVEARPEEVLANVIPFVQSEAGRRVVKPGNEPDLDEVKKWIEWAGAA